MINTVGTDLFPNEIFCEILSHSKSDLVAISCVNRIFKILTENYALLNPPKGCFGEKEWKAYNVNPGVAVPIPLKLFCFDRTKQILTFIPKTLDDKELNLRCFHDFLYANMIHKNDHYFICDNYLSQITKNDKSHWFLLSKEILPETEYESWENQEKIIISKKFMIPNLIDTVVSIILHNYKNDEMLYNAYTLVSDKFRNRSIKVGNYSGNGLFISEIFEHDNSYGFACSLK